MRSACSGVLRTRTTWVMRCRGERSRSSSHAVRARSITAMTTADGMASTVRKDMVERFPGGAEGHTPEMTDQRSLLVGGAAAFFLLAVVSLIIGQSFVAVLAVLGAFALVLAAAFGRRVLPGGARSVDEEDVTPDS